MKRRAKHNFICICLMLIVLILSMSITGFAADVIDTQRTGKITVTMLNADMEAVTETEIELIKVADVNAEEVSYEYTAEFSEFHKELGDLSDVSLAQELAEFVSENEIKGKVSGVDENGVAVFDGLELGVYLFIQNEAAEGYEKMLPFLVSLPIVEDGTYVYEVDALPKMEHLIPVEPDEPSVTPDAPTVTPDAPSVTPDAPTVTPGAPTVTPGEPSLPQTGQLNWPVPALAMLGLILLIVGVYLLNTKEN